MSSEPRQPPSAYTWVISEWLHVSREAWAARWMRWAVAFVWLWTGLAVLHPYYRIWGEYYLAPLGLPPWIMWATCAGEVALALWVALRKSVTWLSALQVV